MFLFANADNTLIFHFEASGTVEVKWDKLENKTFGTAVIALCVCVKTDKVSSSGS